MSFQELQKSSRKLTPQEIRFLLLAGGILVALLILLSSANLSLVRRLPDGGEFYLLRIGARSFLFDRIEPYSASVPEMVQEQVYGRKAQVGDEVYILDIPFHLMPVFFPLAFIPDALVARAVWMGLAELALLAFLLLARRLFERATSPYFVGLVIAFCYFSFYSWQSFLEGSLAFLLGLVYVSILLTLRAQLDELTGVLLVLSSFQWEVGGPFLLFIALSVFWAQRWRVFGGAGMLLFVLLAISFLLYPGWVMPFLRASWNNLRADFGISTREIFNQLWPGHGNTLGWTLSGVLLVTLGYEWSASRGSSFQRVVWVAGLTLAATPLLGFRSELDNLVVLLFPVSLLLMIVRDRWKRLGNGLVWILLAFIFGLPWLTGLGWFPSPGGKTQEFLFLFLPVVTLLGLYWIRWWAIRLPRTWSDQILNLEG